MGSWKIPFLRDIESFPSEFFGCWRTNFEHTNQWQLVAKVNYHIWRRSTKHKTWATQTLCNHVVKLQGKLDKIKAELVRMIKREFCSREFVEVSNSRIYCKDLIKQKRHSRDCGNQTLIVSSKSAGDRDPIHTVPETSHRAQNGVELSISPTHNHREGDGSTEWNSKT